MARTAALTRLSCWLAALVAVVAAVVVAAAPAAHAQSSYSAPLRTAVAGLPVAAEVRTGYDRSLFPHWIDADGDGCNTRYEVLIVEAVTRPSVGSGCALSGGRWYSYYDNIYTTDSSTFDIDHMVALAEAWDSGARSWGTDRRRAFANDLGDHRTLVAVTASSNRSKGDRDPAEWMPSYSAARCTYINEWVAVKIRWRLSVDTAEKNALTSWAASCPNVTITVTRAF